MPSPPRAPDKATCVYCGCDQLTSPDGEDLTIESYVICGKCCAVHRLEVVDGTPILRRLWAHEKEPARLDPGVKAFRDAFQVDQLEARMTRPKDKNKTVVQHGRRLKFEGYGPEHPKFRG